MLLGTGDIIDDEDDFVGFRRYKRRHIFQITTGKGTHKPSRSKCGV